MPRKKVGERVEIDIAGGGLDGKIYEVRGQKVMLDRDLAEIYGYTTKAFNQQVARNIEKFEGEDFMFQLSREEVEYILRSQNVTSRNDGGDIFLRSKNLTSKGDGRGGNRQLPYAFTEQGIYMLMTVLRGELATKQSRSLIRLFKRMKDYIVDSQTNAEYRNNLELALMVTNNARDIAAIRDELGRLGAEVKNNSLAIGEAVRRSEISPIVLDFQEERARELIFLNGQLAKASETYIDIYAEARKSIYIIDNYISIKTLRHLQMVREGTEVVVFSDNTGHQLHLQDYKDFRKEFPGVTVRFIRNCERVHDRFIILDYGEAGERVFHCGASAKDAGAKMTGISEWSAESTGRKILDQIIEEMLGNPELELG